MPIYIWPFAIILGILFAGFFLSCSLDEKKVTDFGKNAVLNHLIHYFGMGLLATFIFGPAGGFVYYFFFQLNLDYLFALPLGIVCGLVVQATFFLIYGKISNR